MDRYTIPHAKTLKPYKQGQLDTLCGLYSAINAIRLAAYPKKKLTKTHARQLMVEGIEYLNTRSNRLSSSLTCGMSDMRRLTLTKHLLRFVNEKWGVSLELQKPAIDKAKNPRAIVIEFIEHYVSMRSSVCIYLNGHHNHYTVISGFNSHSFYLYDSDALNSIVRSRISIEKDVYDSRHILVSKDLFVIKRSEVNSKLR